MVRVNVLRRISQYGCVLFCLVLACLLPAPPAGAARTNAGGDTLAVTAGEPDGMTAVQSLNGLPLLFSGNRGQMDSRVRFSARSAGQAMYLTAQGIDFELLGQAGEDGARERANFSLEFTGSAASPAIEGLGTEEGIVNYLLGDDPSRWYTGIPVHREVIYREIYPGIDLRLYGQDGTIRYDFNVRPGGSFSDIAVRAAGADGLRIDDGALVIETSLSDLRQEPPCIYQDTGGERTAVEGWFRLLTNDTYGFNVGAYDPGRTLIIDPTLTYGSYLGGSGDDVGRSVAVDGAGNVYIAGETTGADFPAAGYKGGATDVFVAKINPNTIGPASLIYCTYLGGSGSDLAGGIAVDSSGNACVAGSTNSSNFPNIGAFQGYQAAYDGFVTRLGATGSITYSTFLGGSGDDAIEGVALDASNYACLAGETASPNFPLKNAYRSSLGGPRDGFVARLNPGQSGAAGLTYSTYFGGSGNDGAADIAVLKETGIIYTGGFTDSSDFPRKGAFQTALRGSRDGFIASFNPVSGGDISLYYSSYLGGAGEDAVRTVNICPVGCLYASGWTGSNDFPVTTPYQDYQGGVDGFFTRISPDGTHIYYSTYLGGSGDDYVNSMAANKSDGSAVLTGETTSADLPVKATYQGSLAGGRDAFIFRINPFAPIGADTFMLFASYLGGSKDDIGYGAAVDSYGGVIVTGETKSGNFPSKNAYQAAFKGGERDAFLARIGGVYPTVTTSEATNTTGNSARLNGELTSIGTGFPTGTTVSFEWGTAAGTYPNETTPQTIGAAGPFTADLAGLTAGSTYYFRAKVNGDGVSYGLERSFRATPPVPPAVTTSAAANVSDLDTKLNGNLTALGSAQNVQVSFHWGPTTAYANTTGPVTVTAAGPFSTDLTGLAPDTTYHFRARASGAGVALGEDKTFKTLAPRLAVRTGEATAAAGTSATLGGTLSGLGGAASVAVSFEYGTTTAYGKVMVARAMTAPGPFTVTVTGLSPFTTYHFRAKAVGATTVTGADATFNTPGLQPSVATGSPTSVSPTEATLNGVLTNLGGLPQVMVSFEWGLTTGYGNTTPSQAMPAPGTFNAPVTGLTANSTYHFRAKATGNGTSYGIDRAFVARDTPPPPPPPPPGGGGGGAGGGGGGGGGAGYYDLVGFMGPDGIVAANFDARSGDGKIKLTLPKGTRYLSGGVPGRAINVVPLLYEETPPSNGVIIGRACNLGPEGGVFEPAIPVTFTYKADTLPPGVSEKGLVIAFLDSQIKKWVPLENCRVDTASGSVTGRAGHFSTFALVATAPAAFSVSGLSVTPERVDPGAEVTVSAIVSNGSEISGLCVVLLKADGKTIESKEMLVPGASTRPVTFKVSLTGEGLHNLDLNGLKGVFEVKPAPAAFKVSNLTVTPQEVDSGKDVTVSVQVSNTGRLPGTYSAVLKVNGTVSQTKEVGVPGGANQVIDFKLPQVKDGSYAIEVNGVSAAFKVKPAPAVLRLSDLKIFPLETEGGKDVTVTVRATNTGNAPGTFSTVLKVDGIPIETRTLALGGGASQPVMFSISRDAAGTYSISVEDLGGTFTVRQAASGISMWIIGGMAAAALVALLIIILNLVANENKNKSRK